MNVREVVKALEKARQRPSILVTKLAALDLFYRYGNQHTPSLRCRHGVEPCTQL
jgi:hypothetical protein